MCMLHWDSWQPGSGDDPTGLGLVIVSDVNADPDGQPSGHYHQSFISPWGVAIAAHGMANDNHIIVLGEISCPPEALLLPLQGICSIQE